MWPCGLIEVPSLVRFVVLLLTPIDVLFDCLRTLAINSIYASEKRHCSLNMETPSPETPQQPTFTPERFLMAAIVAAVLAVNLACGYLVGEFDPTIHLVLTTFTPMVLLGIVATVRHPTSRVTWMTTALNGCVMLLWFCVAYVGRVPIDVLFFPLVSLLIMLVVCIFFWSNWVRSDRGSPRFVRYYLISARVCWSVSAFFLLLIFLVMFGGTV